MRPSTLLGAVQMDQDELYLTKDGFRLPLALFLRIITRSIFMLPLPFVAFYFDQFFIMWFSLAFIGIVIGWQIVAYGIFGEQYTDKNLNIDVVDYYGKKTLIFSAICWALLIVGLSVVLYLKLP